ncbi:acyl-coa-binding domain-containing protein 4 [Phtheirospermum japonicum]|uniref:Acyl-coa-binding domain-containing protein 4 n=1 Tax=Phtheirospermum japonicum TaxID=374723 RepID=A0A830D632_9LAMI|nr:acyl-coa-binding domain-containing protein 4 [Phtheirospermum japonicum]
MAAMARAGSGLAYPERFYAAASYAGFSGSPNSAAKGVASKFSNDTALLLYALYQQNFVITNVSVPPYLSFEFYVKFAALGPCNIPKPRGWSPIEQSKWTSWNELGNMASTEAMRLFVKILEEEDPGWYSRVSNFVAEPVLDVEINKKVNASKLIIESIIVSLSPPSAIHHSHSQLHFQAPPTLSAMLPPALSFSIPFPLWPSISTSISPQVAMPTHNPEVVAVSENGNNSLEAKAIPTENGNLSETQHKDVYEGLGVVSAYDQWAGPTISGPRPKARYEHGAAVIDDKMYIFGGNHNGRYLNDLQVLNMRSWTWSKVEVQAGTTSCAGHSLIPWDGKLLSVAGHTKDPSENLQGKVFDLQTCTWSTLKTYGKPPVSRGGQSVTLVGMTLVIFGGQDANRSLLNDLHILDLESMTWDEMDTV